MRVSSPVSGAIRLSFDTIFYYVTDMDTALAFYRDTLGLPLVSHNFIARFDLDGVLIELVPVPPGSVVPGNGNARLCFSVLDIGSTVQQLRNRGIDVGEVKSKQGGKLAFFRDPDGNELSLWQADQTEDAREIVHSALMNG